MNRKFVLCVENRDYPASLEKHKVYQVIADADAERMGQIRVMDESGEDYLYPRALFADVILPAGTLEAITRQS